jgi:hypothetical protein
MSNLTEFFLSSNKSAAQLECLEISHPNFSKTYRIVRNGWVGGCTVTHEDSTPHDYDYYPCRITKSGITDDMDSSLKIELGDLGDIVSSEMAAVRAANGFGTKPEVKFRVYRSDILGAPINGPFNYEVQNFAFNRTGTVFNAVAPFLNNTGTGEVYKIVRFPMLRGFL